MTGINTKINQQVIHPRQFFGKIVFLRFILIIIIVAMNKPQLSTAEKIAIMMFAKNAQFKADVILRKNYRLPS